MRVCVFTVLLLILSALSLPLIGLAQKFTEPTREELQMTSDPKAPGASAVYLYREEINDHRNHAISSYARIKILSPEGAKWAVVEVPSFGEGPPPIIEGRTIRPNGEVVPLAEGAQTLLKYHQNDGELRTAYFTLPQPDPGSILEYRWKLPILGSGNLEDLEGQPGGRSVTGGPLPYWDVQKELFIHKERFYFDAVDPDLHPPQFHLTEPVSILYKAYLPQGYKVRNNFNVGNLIVGGRGGPGLWSGYDFYSLDIEDVPPYKREVDAPPEIGTIYGVRFYLTRMQYVTRELSVDSFWLEEGKNWARTVDQVVGVSSALQAAVGQITVGADTPEAKARKLYDAIQTLDNTDFARVKSMAERRQPHLSEELRRAQDVWTEKVGSSNDIAALYLALARAAGLQADGVMVADRSRHIFDHNYPSLDQLDALLVVLHIDGKDIYLDPGEKRCPFGQLHWSHTLAGGLEQNAKGPVYTPQNLSKDGMTAHSADLTLDVQRGVTGIARILMNGPEALRWRQLNLTSAPEEVRRKFNESLHDLLPQGITGEVDHFQGLDSPAANLLAVVKVSGQLGTSTGKRLLLPGFFFSTGAHAQFESEEKRENAIDLHYAAQAIDDVVYHLPAGYTVESAPQQVQLPWRNHAVLVIKTASGAGSIEIKHIFARSFVLLEAKEYPALREYYQKLATNDQQQLVLAPAVGAIGN